ncbi:DDB1- and CUL4-associated factor 17 isoform X2 [Rhinatrema bivittatum]|uniref:DDB1- and CUL4-associated factor 17 isoform X2 n=1 Tax=Rhinatrema bivittatum TaxID=194408 RepID=UPI00112CA219|nr:DDB1- and CUL4-associated factor 17 isoform X2 [Rhinatrema bivittatum]
MNLDSNLLAKRTTERMCSRQRSNICCFLTIRSYGCSVNCAGAIHRRNMSFLRKLVCQGSTKFQKVWTKHSKSPIVYERGRIYFDNYRCCFNSVTSEPHHLYELPKCSKLEKIEDALLCESPVGETLPKPSDYKPSLIVVTGHNWLLRLSANTGEILEKIYLASYCKFRYLTWDVPQETIVAKSSQKKLTAAEQRAGRQQPGLLYLAVFKILPLSLMGMLEINKNFMQQRFDLRQACNWSGMAGVVGDFPFGIPCNIKITDTPPLLFQVSCLENSFQIGGYPWHYIITPNKKDKGTYHICSLSNNVLAKNGIQDMKCCSLESDWIYFHPDTSSRVIHVGPNKINILKLKEMEMNSQIEEDFIILAKRETKVNRLVTVTASGRVVKKRFDQLDDDPEQETFKVVDYEDELDLLAVVAVTQTDTDGRAHVDFYSNDNGKLLKSIRLMESWDVTYSHEVYFDRDTVIHIEQKPNRVFCCYVYKMICNAGERE